MARNTRQLDRSSTAAQAVPRHRRARRPSGVRIAFGFIAFVLALSLVLAGVFAGNRWLRDDAADLGGTWYVAETVVPVVFEDGRIVLSQDVSYDYSIDEKDKTIGYRLGNLEGQGRYWFSADRSHLYIEDGRFGFLDTLRADLVWTAGELKAALSGEGALMPGERGCVVFSREPGSRSRAEVQARADALFADGDGSVQTASEAARSGGDQADGAAGEDGAGGVEGGTQEDSGAVQEADVPAISAESAVEGRKLSDGVFASVGEEAYVPARNEEGEDGA